MQIRTAAFVKKIICYLERIVLGFEQSFGAKLIRALLFPLSLLYSISLQVYLWIYKVGWRKRMVLDVPVVSVGNLTFGGTGKTPVVIAICNILQASGYRPVVLSRGHGGSSKHSLVVSNGSEILCSSKRCGDEPIVLARNLPKVPIVVGKDRRSSAKLARNLFNPTILVMDDGLQYWQLARDLDIAVMNSKRPFGSGLLMPAGDLREPISGLKRTALVLINCETELTEEQFEQIRQKVHSYNPNAAVYKCYKTASGFVNANTGEEHAIDWARNRKVAAFCGIGNPESFERTLQDTGADILALLAFRDHQWFTEEDLSTVKAKKEELGADAIVTTEKDASRLTPEDMPAELFVLNIDLEIEDRTSFEKHITNWDNRENTEVNSEETTD